MGDELNVENALKNADKLVSELLEKRPGINFGITFDEKGCYMGCEVISNDPGLAVKNGMEFNKRIQDMKKNKLI